MRNYDFIVVGGGSAGAIAAARLAGSHKGSVLLLEAGRAPLWPLHSLPIFAGIFPRMNWGMWQSVTEPEANLGGRALNWPQGRVLGGSSSVNGMVWLRGRPADYEGWAASGATGWSWSDIEPVFDALEGRGTAGTSGIRIARQVADDPLDRTFLNAARQAGYPLAEDFNDPRQEGVGCFSVNIDRGRRVASTEFLRSTHRRNLTIRTGRQALKLHLANSRVTAITVRYGRSEETYHSSNIVLCCGAINTPKLLMLSGIGDVRALEKAGVSALHDLPGVGANLQDHLSARVRISCREQPELQKLTRIDRAARSVALAAAFGKGRAARSPFSTGFIMRSSADEPQPDIQALFIPGPSAGRPWIPGVSRDIPEPSCFAGVYVLKPESRGQLMLRSAHPDDPVRIHANYLVVEKDRERLRRGIGIVQDIMSQDAFAAVAANPKGLPQHDLTCDPDELMTHNSGTAFHYAGTCRMGPDDAETSVVTPRLQVRGIDGLMIADASVMPTLTSGNTNAPSMMIGHRVSEFIR